MKRIPKFMKIAAAVLAVVVLLFVVTPPPVTHACGALGNIVTLGGCALWNNVVNSVSGQAGDIITKNFTTLSFSAISSVMFWIAEAFSFIFGIVIAIEAWFLEIILGLSFNLVNATPVKIGFPIVLAFANLVFVAGLVVVAIATIIRQEEYGVKKILWRLVATAILVNFGLVICGAMLNASDQLSYFFLQSISPASTGQSGSAEFGGFAGAMAGAFNPQKIFITPQQASQNPADTVNGLNGGGTSANGGGQTIAAFAGPFVSLLGTVGSLVLIIITLGVLIAMLLYRYVKLGLYLIILPVAWAAGVFPAYQEHYKKWWTDFTKLAIYPPVMLFFMWLGLKVSTIMAQGGDAFNFTLQPGAGAAPDGIGAGILASLKGALSGTIEEFLRVFIVFAIFMAGMEAAEKLGVKFADVGQKAISGTGKWASNQAAHWSKRGARNAYQKVRLGKLNKALTNSRFATVANVGRRMETLTQKGGADVVEAVKKDHSFHIPDTDAGRAELLTKGLTLPQQLAILSKMDDMGKVKKIGQQSMAEWMQKNHKNVENFGQHGIEAKLKEVGMSGAVLHSLNDPVALPGAMKKAMEDGDPKKLAAWFKDGAFGLSDAELVEISKAISVNLKDVFSGDQFIDFTAGLKKDQKDNLIASMQSLIRDQTKGRGLVNIPPNVQTSNSSDQATYMDPAVYKAAVEANRKTATDALGSDIAEVVRFNGPLQNRGFNSEVLWNEPRVGKDDPRFTSANAGSPAQPQQQNQQQNQQQGGGQQKQQTTHAAPAAPAAPSESNHTPAPGGGHATH